MNFKCSNRKLAAFSIFLTIFCSFIFWIKETENIKTYSIKLLTNTINLKNYSSRPVISSNLESSHANNDRIKYIMYECVDDTCSGLADRMKGIMVTYAISLLTDRKLVINFTIPCNLKNYLQPNRVNWLIDIPSYLSRKELYIDWMGKINESDFSKINFMTHLKDIDVLVVRTGMALVKHLTFNPAHHAKIKELKYRIQNFNIEKQFHRWFRNLFKLTLNMQVTYKKIMNKLKPTRNTKLICAQIRTGTSLDIQFMKFHQLKLYWSIIREKLLSQTSDYRIFVTSDNPSVIDEAYKEFGENILVGFKANSFHIVEKTDCKNIGELILDFRILGDCDMGVISQSGFGLIGILNNPNLDLKHFYVFTNPDILKVEYYNRTYLSFHQLDYSLLYLEFN